MPRSLLISLLQLILLGVGGGGGDGSTSSVVTAWTAVPLLASSSSSWPSLSRSRLFSSSSNDNDIEKSKKSIADYTLGLHGGKYEFGDASFSPMGQAFAESLYSSGDGDANLDNDKDRLENEPLPPWAERLAQTNVLELLGKKNAHEQHFQVVLSNTAESASAEIVITNEEMTWEPYYAFVVREQQHQQKDSNHENGEPSSSSPPPPFTIKPRAGMLERRGGQARLQVKQVGPIDDPKKDQWWILVGTEEDSWAYRIIALS